MVWLHFIFLFAIIIYAAKLGGIGVGMAGGLGMAVAVFLFGIPVGTLYYPVLRCYTHPEKLVEIVRVDAQKRQPFEQGHMLFHGLLQNTLVEIHPTHVAR